MLQAIGRVLFWRYRRGSWQYDIACAVILAFIFLTPKSVFDGSFFERQKPGTAELRTGLVKEPAPVSGQKIVESPEDDPSPERP